jgi:CBS domain-containing membrane protein
MSCVSLPRQARATLAARCARGPSMTADPARLTAENAPHTLRQWLRAFWPARFPIDRRERLRVLLGAFAGILLTAALARALAGSGPLTAWLLAPIGASAVLVFAAPSSPLAQPWAVVGGNAISALVGLACAAWVPDPVLASALAVALAIGTMLVLRCLHPPGGAMALLAVLMHGSGGQLAFCVALVDSLLLVGAGLAYHRLAGKRYPHAQGLAAAPAPGVRARFQAADLDAVLERYNEVLDVSRDDLEALLLAAELEGHRRRLGDIRCRDVMSAGIVTVEYGSALQEAWDLMRTRGIKALPVLDRGRRIIGILTLADYLRAARADGHRDLRRRLLQLLRPDGRTHSEKAEVVGQIMTRAVRTVGQDEHVIDLMPVFTHTGHHHLPVIDAERRVVGMITQSDFVRVLHEGNFQSALG